jgi:ADP-ribose pyrophosphatase YjhB (NUDIX family)
VIGRAAADASGRLAAFLSGRRPLAEEGIIWPAARLICRAYACEELPPLDPVTSVRCIVRREGNVLVLSRTTGDGDECHIVPGGRREAGAAIEETLRREVLEETGWTVGEPRFLGVVVFRHVLPRPREYAFPYPEFAQLVFTAEALAHHPEAMAPDEIDGEATFMAIERAQEMRLSAWQREFLKLAVDGGARVDDGR